ncbi:MAG: putative transposase [Streptomyces sp.]|jgi:hypothetical protein|nr:putative transposase [Streptomyces sp.]
MSTAARVGRVVGGEGYGSSCEDRRAGEVKLLPTAGEAVALRSTLHACNVAANWVSQVAFERGVPREYVLRKHTYAEVRRWQR